MSLVHRLYRGETDFNFVGTRKRWYVASAIVLVICFLSIGLRGFNFGIEFKGGTSFQFSVIVQSHSASNTVIRIRRNVGSGDRVVGYKFVLIFFP